jgi:hypothetical protein
VTHCVELPFFPHRFGAKRDFKNPSASDMIKEGLGLCPRNVSPSKVRDPSTTRGG